MADLTSNQASINKQIEASLQNINKSLVKQLQIQNLLNLSAEERARDAAAAGRITDDQLRSIGVSAATVSTGMGSVISNTRELGDATQGWVDHLGDAGFAILNVGSQAASTYDKMGEVLNNVAPEALKKELNDIQDIFGGLGSDDGPFAATNKQARIFVKATQEAYAGLFANKGAFREAFGSKPLRALGNLEVVMRNFQNVMAGGQGVLNSLRIGKVATGEFILENRALVLSMNLSADEQQAIMSRQISRTGKASNDMLRKVALYSKRLGKLTDDSMKEISKNIVHMIKDTEKFGMVTEGMAARTSIHLRQLGMSYEDLGGALDKFANFDTAVKAVGDLTTAFGVQLDAMEMMKLANTDPDMMLLTLRDAFLATGQSAEDLGHAGRKAMSSLTGLKYQGLERLLNPTTDLTAIHEMTEATKDQGETTAQAMKILSDDIVGLKEMTDRTAADMRNNINEGLRIPLAETAIQAENTAARMADAFEAAIPAGIEEKLGDFLGSDFGMSLKTGMEVAFNAISDLFSGLMTKLTKMYEASGAAGHSISPWGKSMRDGLLIGFNEVKVGAGKDLESMNSTATTKLEELQAKASASYKKISLDQKKMLSEGISDSYDPLEGAIDDIESSLSSLSTSQMEAMSDVAGIGELDSLLSGQSLLSPPAPEKTELPTVSPMPSFEPNMKSASDISEKGDARVAGENIVSSQDRIVEALAEIKSLLSAENRQQDIKVYLDGNDIVDHVFNAEHKGQRVALYTQR